jgi:hypothetical protein
MVMNDTCLDRLLKQRSALPKPGHPFDLPPPRGGFRSLSGAARCPAAEIKSSIRSFIQGSTNS